MQASFFILFLVDLLGDQCVNWDNSKTSLQNKSDFLFLSPFSNVPPFLKFKSLTDPSSEIPKEIQNELLWADIVRVQDINNMNILLSHSGFERTKNRTSATYAFDHHLDSCSSEDKENHDIKNEFEKVNHVPNIIELDSKDKLSKNLKAAVKSHGSSDFPFIIPTFIIPDEIEEFIQTFEKLPSKLWVQKPSNLSKSLGIEFFNNLKDFRSDNYSVVQKYIENPMLVEGRKSEVRKYVLLTGFDPIRIFTLGEDMIKVSHRPFTTSRESLYDKCIHTPYYLQCKKDDLIRRKTSYSRRERLIVRSLREQNINWKTVDKKMDDAVIKIVLSVADSIRNASYNTLKNRYHTYNLMGFDFFIDNMSNIYLNEVNRRPSLGTNTHHKIISIASEILNIAGYHLPPFLSNSSKNYIAKTFNLDPKLDPSFSSKLYSFSLTDSAKYKHAYFENKFRVEEIDKYGDEILGNLTEDDVKLLLIAEGELSRIGEKTRRIYPNENMEFYGKYVGKKGSYYSMLLSAWEKMYGGGKNRKRAIRRLKEESKRLY